MPQKPLSSLTNQELLQEAKKQKSTAITNALLIGFLIGVIVYSIVENTWGLLTLIPIYFVYKLVNKPKPNRAELEALLKERNLK